MHIRLVLIALIFVSQLVISCGLLNNSVQLELEDGVHEITITPDRELVSMCKLKVKGTSSCNILIELEANKTLCISKGKIDFWYNYEWYNKSRKVRVLTDSCAGSDIMTVQLLSLIHI